MLNHLFLHMNLEDCQAMLDILYLDFAKCEDVWKAIHPFLIDIG